MKVNGVLLPEVLEGQLVGWKVHLRHGSQEHRAQFTALPSSKNNSTTPSLSVRRKGAFYLESIQISQKAQISPNTWRVGGVGMFEVDYKKGKAQQKIERANTCVGSFPAC